eukprot:gb/GECG01008998.1/.p1 GENE.gb/GECG01008998.1/~~gb/GECG01008998.1/.p1  ORF type:complete len:211 (+),score=30.89 gb/GECG01008998.1/:1-633(+)
MPTNKKQWCFVAGDKRHTVEVEHNVITGKQVIKRNGEVIHYVKAKYQLTGDVSFKIEEMPAKLSIQAEDTSVVGGFRYLLLLNGSLVTPHVPSQNLENYYVTCLYEDGRKETVNVQFDHDTFDVWVDDTRLNPDKGEIEADFLEDGCEGSLYKFFLPNQCPAHIQVIPSSGRKGSRARLFVGKDLHEVAAGDDNGQKNSIAPPPSSDIVG